MPFVDTSVLLYSISRAPDEQDKAKQANEILGRRDLALSVQVLQEFYVQATRTSRPTLLPTSRQSSSSSYFSACPFRTSPARS